MFSRNKVAAVAAEFLGTGVLTLVLISVQRSTIGVPYFVGIAAGLAVALMVLMFGQASRGFFNPAITIGLWTARRIRTLEAVAYVVAQLLGGYLAGQLYRYFVNNSLAAIGSKFDSRILVAEAVGTAIFAMAVAAAVYFYTTDSRKAALSGAGLTLGIIAASAASAGILNPAVALGANAWAWGTFVLGPVLGGIIGINLYGLIFAPANAFSAVAASNVTTRNTAVATTSAPVEEPVVAKKSTKVKAPVVKKAKTTTAKKKTTTAKRKR